MKQILLFLTLFVALSSWSQNVYIPDANFRRYLFLTPNIDTNGDNEISFEEAKTVTEMDVSYRKISSLKGIEAFVNLTTLRCKNNTFTRLDVSSLTRLTVLDCFGNKKLTSINLRGLKNLTVLDCSVSNLNSLSVNHLTKLTKLSCRFNNLSNLNVSALTRLTELSCGMNDLRSLDLKNLKNLEKLYCYDDNLSSLDLSGLSKLTFLSCGENGMSRLNLRGLSSLEKLYCYKNRLSTLDVSSLTSLKEFRCDSNYLTSLDLRSLKNLTSLNCEKNRITSLNVGSLTKLGFLKCSNNKLTTLMLNGAKSLYGVYCENNSLTSLNVGGLTELFFLDCSSNKLTTLDLKNLADLRSLKCSSNKLTSLNVSNYVSFALLDCSSNELTYLNVSNLPKLTNLKCFSNSLTSLDVSSALRLAVLNCRLNKISCVKLRDIRNVTYRFRKDFSASYIDATKGSVTFNKNTLPVLSGACRFNLEDLKAPTAVDNCSGETLTATNSLTKPLTRQGVHEIVWKYTSSIYTFQQTQKVIINDVTAPIPSVASLALIRLECEIELADLKKPTATDNCKGKIIGTTDFKFSLTKDEGTYQITWIYNDGNKNISKQIQQLIIDDVSQPIVDLTTLETIHSECSIELADLEKPTATDNCKGKIIGTTDFKFSLTKDEGTYQITWIYNDGRGNVSKQIQQVIIDDITKPIVAVTTLETIHSECSIELIDLKKPTATDNCKGKIIGTTDFKFNLTKDEGTYQITWTYDDGRGNTSTQIQQVIIDDITPPIVTVTTLETIHSECSIELIDLKKPTATDNCKGKIIGTTDFKFNLTKDEGTYQITWTYDDGRGNTSTQIQQVIIDDITPPIVTVTTLETIHSECNIELVDLEKPTATDNCKGKIIGTTDFKFSLTKDEGTYQITWIYNDGRGNISTQIQQVIIDDITKPIAAITTLETIHSECSIELEGLEKPTATDNCKGKIIGTTDFKFSLTKDEGTYQITWIYNDGRGNVSKQIQQVIIDDSTKPILAVTTLETIHSECSIELADLEKPTATDNCKGKIIGTTDFKFNLTKDEGTYQITWTYDDEKGNVSKQIQQVIIDDSTKPILAITTLETIHSECEIELADLEKPTATDNCKGKIIGTTDFKFSLTKDEGTYQITWTYNDGKGNVSTQIQQVIIDDSTKPILAITTLETIHSECEIELADLEKPTATDNCKGGITGTTDFKFNLTKDEGTYQITWIYNDGRGNVSKQIQQVIIDDSTKPILAVTTLETIHSECSIELADLEKPTATDNCKGNIIGTTDFKFSLTKDEGTYQITWTYNDGKGNVSTQIQQVIIDDSTKPILAVTTLETIHSECSIELADLEKPTATDNCKGEIIGTTDFKFNLTKEEGTYQITWIYNDGRGNVSTQIQQVIIDDSTKPIVAVAALETIHSECSIELEDLKKPTATDNCKGEIIGTTDFKFSQTKEEGTYEIIWTYDDGRGNISTQIQQVIIDDITKPIATVTALETIHSECNIELTDLKKPTATDNCKGKIIGTTDFKFSLTKDEGTYQIIWNYDDGRGNISTQIQQLIIDDSTKPIVAVAALETIHSECEIELADLEKPAATDNCKGKIIGATDFIFSQTKEEGTYQITWIYDDGRGNSTTQTQRIIIDDITVPEADEDLLTITGQFDVRLTAPTATDNCVGTLTATTSDPVHYDEIGTFTTTWFFDDGRGNISSQTQIVIIGASVESHGFSPNDDGINDTWTIDGIETYKNCKVQVFGREGTKVYEKRGYKNTWDGYSNTGSNKKMMSGAYYFIVEFNKNGLKPISGWLYINY